MNYTGLGRRAFAMALVAGATNPVRAQTRPASGVVSIVIVGAGPMNLAPQGLLQGLEEHNLVLGKDYAVRYVPEAAMLEHELQKQTADVIFATGSIGVHAARKATSTIPIVAVDLESEPLAEKLIQRFSRPGGNLTGMFLDQPGLATKWLQYLVEAVPRLRKLAVLRQATTATGQLEAVRVQGARYNLSLELFEFQADTLDAAFAKIVEARPQGLMVLSSPLIVSSRARLAQLATVAKLPSITMFRVYAEAGGLMAFGPDPMTMGHRAASYVVRLLRGARAAELPIEQPSRFELAINLTTARALNVTLPHSTLVTADAVFE